MKHYCNTLAVLVLSALACGLFVSVWPAAGFGRDTAEPQEGWAPYQVILERNIFSRQRGPRRQRDDDREQRPVVVPNPESYFRLRGIAQEDSVFVAFVEDTQTGGVLRLREGDRVARGAIKSLTLDTIEYEFDGRAMIIRMGQDLEGGQGTVTTGELLEWSQTAAPTTGQTGTGEPEAPTQEEAEILRQLMERRKQQGG